MSGPAPSKTRRRRNAPARGDWKATPGIGWQHGAIPAPPDGLMEATRSTWTTWCQSWVASHWTPSDLPGLRLVAKLYDQVERGEFVRMAELRQLMDSYGITPKGQQDRRWTPPEAEVKPPAAAPVQTSRYAGLRVVNE